jgi:hypothetical protein
VIESKEEVEITDEKGNEYKVTVPKIKVCPYPCVGCEQYRSIVDQERRERIVANLPKNGKWGDYGAYKKGHTSSGITVVQTTFINSDDETIDNSDAKELILTGVTGKGRCFMCGKEGPKYKICKDISCEETIRKTICQRTRGRFMPMKTR